MIGRMPGFNKRNDNISHSFAFFIWHIDTSSRINKVFSIFFMRKISLVSILIITTIRIFRTAVTCTRRTITTIAGERFKISTIVTDMIVRTVFHISTINFIRRFVNKFSMFFDFFTNSRLVLADGKSDSSFSRAVFDTFFNDDSFLNSKM